MFGQFYNIKTHKKGGKVSKTLMNLSNIEATNLKLLRILYLYVIGFSEVITLVSACLYFAQWLVIFPDMHFCNQR